MKTHYEWLDLPQSAEPETLKRAYYKAVKIFPPEHYPEEFAQIKTAYDTLCDPALRAAYDETLKLNAFSMVRLDSARMLRQTGKTGKAVKEMEALLKEEPTNRIIMLELANAYAARGYCHKAIAQYEAYLAIDELAMDVWYKYIFCQVDNVLHEKLYDSVMKAARLNIEHNLQNIDILVVSILFLIDKDEEIVKKCFGFLQNANFSNSKVADPLGEILRTVDDTASDMFLDDALRLARHVTPQDYQYPMVERLRTVKELLAIDKDDQFDSVYPALFNLLLNKVETDDERLQLLAMENYIIRERLMGQTRKVKEKYPRLYALHGAFFQRLLIEKNRTKMLDENFSGISKLKHRNTDGDLTFIADEDDDPVKPVPVRVGPKIGRNDPCPCGSGKKYKKCCGA